MRQRNMAASDPSWSLKRATSRAEYHEDACSALVHLEMRWVSVEVAKWTVR